MSFVLFATCINAPSDACQTLPALIAVTANCNFSFLFSSLNSTGSNDDPDNLHNLSKFRNSPVVVMVVKVGLAVLCLTQFLHPCCNFAHAD